MTPTTLGDMRQFFLTNRANTAAKTDLNRLVQEMTSGQVSDLTKHLGAGQTNLAGLDRQLGMLDRYADSNADLSQMLSVMQAALGGIDAQRATASTALISINEGSLPTQIETTADIARTGFRSTVQALNTRYGDRTLFGGNDPATNPMADADVMLAELKASISGFTTDADIITAIEDWFDTPGGGFETIGYLGDANGTASRAIDGTQSVDVALRADDQSIRDTLKAFALGALAGDDTVSLDIETRQTLQQQAGYDLLAAASSLAGAQARLGSIEGQVEEASVRVAAQQTSYGIARNEMTSADPYETAVRLQSVQVQLETQYALTARLSRLSLTEYLR